MLFDEKDLRIFDNSDSRNYFKEILQSYYSQNYRATIVLLYSFVIYDLFIKLQTMVNDYEDDNKAKNKLEEINKMISDDKKYSMVENEIISFFRENYSLYFDTFVEDIEYLKKCRHKCAHLKVNDNSLVVPSDYHARMLICSMYDHVFSVKAPFIMDLFSIAKGDVERYSLFIIDIPSSGLEESIRTSITEKYLKRMTYESLKMSYKSFTRMLFVSNDETCIQYAYGLYAFTFAMTDFIIKQGSTSIIQDEQIISMFSRIRTEELDKSPSRLDALISLMIHYPVIMDIVRDNSDMFDYVSKRALTRYNGLTLYSSFFPRKSETAYGYLKQYPTSFKASDSKNIYDSVKECEDFNLSEFTRIMVKAIPTYNGFDAADRFMTFFKNQLEELTIEEIEGVLNIYNQNSQCKNRSRHATDKAEIDEYIKKKEAEAEDDNPK